ncbi:MAG: hypothetical protein H7Z42_00790 [Roseiflexaceae bacterium]|nr:hypothetical protein [Roseiflexaceae bacterium]
MDKFQHSSVPACRVGATPEQIAREADRAVLYGAILAAQRPATRIKPHLVEAVAALTPAVRAFLQGAQGDEANFALEYARACGGEAFLVGKRSVPGTDATI